MARRRHRLFIFCAIIAIIIIYRFLQNSWTEQSSISSTRPPATVPQAIPNRPDHIDELTAAHQPHEHLKEAQNPTQDDKPKPNHVGQGPTGGDERDDFNKRPSKGPSNVEKLSDPSDLGAPKQSPGSVNENTGADGNAPLSWLNPPKDDPLEQKLKDSRVHWTKPKEHFPLPSESITPLPKSSAKPLPKIQYDFGTESQKAKATRLERQKRVKTELARSWAGYKKNAWMHDELSPVSGRFRDPFCGWAATLVDTLDMLWIVGLKDEFDEAAKAAREIDFTYTPRFDIPVFETTIRYLGGLLAAFDVSGGHQGSYGFLLDKAVELAEILIGIFDTPNRMPLLYYQWKPDYTSQPHSAGQVGIAELASLSMEFTRLAQVTAEDKYYDAIDRITNALVGLQTDGTLIPGLFPESLDASGCNRTATQLRDSLSKSAKDQVDSQEPLAEPEGFGGRSSGLGSILDQNRKETAGAFDDRKSAKYFGSRASPMKGRWKAAEDSVGGLEKRDGPYAAGGEKSKWDCVPQGLVPGGFGLQKFHMGGGQDSAYEYFPKEYQLLGGREAKYQKLYEDAADAVEKQLLFRPMVKGDWDILFPAKLSTYGGSVDDFRSEYEVAHLTCFIGGMFGLGGKLFAREKDIETAKKLTDGCVWAYQSTTSGIMPEQGHVIPCPSKERCDFNETRWWAELDSSKDWRNERVQKWEAAQKDKKSAARAEEMQSDVDNNGAEKASSAKSGRQDRASGIKMSRIYRKATIPMKEKKTSSDGNEEGSELPESLRKKLGKGVRGKPAKASSASGKDEDGTSSVASDSSKFTQHGTLTLKSGDSASDKPQSHEEWVKEKIERDRLPPGYIDVPGLHYILRPEAIESVWYMYRITGDPEWMEKGWRMFEATVRATRTSIANSAVDNVLSDEPRTKDEMESFWMAETLKYYYLLFSEPTVISLDDWVLNTEAHPFKL
ncbi:hypothetical protein HIM_03656 [Hirsutella minnesotensis 3608]|uniref:alpha-1,2-Mannosidase n=1 Tax=Hirsutella minnesotensis 3608 TaxID=1043627 RepID=A0A0F8A6B3_9HYPO|nr:hypothetical protein HIM_03656 [Hirsutella minnesotensis 3608]